MCRSVVQWSADCVLSLARPFLGERRLIKLLWIAWYNFQLTTWMFWPKDQKTMRLRFWEDCDSSQNLSLTLGTFSISVWVLWDALDFVIHKMTFAVLLWIFWFKQVHMFTSSHHFGSSICSAFDWGKQNHLQSRETDPFKVKSSRFVMCPINSANKFRRTRVESYSLDSAVIFSFF